MLRNRIILSCIGVVAGIAVSSPTFAKKNTMDVEEVIEEVIEVEAADSTAADYFVSAPTAIFPTIDVMTRMDMIDYFQAGSEKASKNLFGGDCRITVDTAEKLTVITSGVSEYTIDLLPAPGKKQATIVMLTRTLQTPGKDVSISFYDCDWNETESLLPTPTLANWILPTAKNKREDIENAVPFVMSTMTYDPTSRTATFTNTIADYIDRESKELVESSIAKSLTYRWNGKKFILEK